MRQGSILGPQLFILYVNDMCNVSKLLKFILFADDTNIFYSHDRLPELVNVLNTELDNMYTWFCVNKLSLNVAKTNCRQNVALVAEVFRASEYFWHCMHARRDYSSQNKIGSNE